MIGRLLSLSFPCLVIALSLYPYVHTENIALNKRATQIGTFGGQGPQFAVDGNLTQSPWGEVCSWPHSLGSGVSPAERGQPAWWSVDLASHNPSQRFVVLNVSIYNCNDGCIENDRTYRIYVGEESGWQRQTECGHNTLIFPESILTISCTPDKAVRYLTVRTHLYIGIALCEVVVNGYQYQDCPDGRWGQGSVNCQTLCPTCQYSCNDITGLCRECSLGRFGIGCTSVCNCQNTTEICFPTDGFCRSGCPPGFSGTGCFPQVSKPTLVQPPTVVGTSFTSVILQFPTSEPPASYYILEYRTQDGDYTAGARAQEVTPGRFQVTQTGLQSNTVYQFKIVPYAAGGVPGITSNRLFHRTLALPEIYTTPRQLSVTSTSVTVDFQPPNPPSDSYRLEYSKDGSTYTEGATVSHTSGPLRITQGGLEPNTYYSIRIVPLVGQTEGRPSPSLGFYTQQASVLTSSSPVSYTQTSRIQKNTVPISPEATTISIPSPSPKGTEYRVSSTVETVKAESGLVGIISGVVVAVVFLIILAIVITYLVTRARVGRPVQLKCTMCACVESTTDSVKNQDRIRTPAAEPVSNVDQEMKVIRDNRTTDDRHVGQQSLYEELEDTSYQELREPYTGLVPGGEKKTGKYVNVDDYEHN